VFFYYFTKHLIIQVASRVGNVFMTAQGESTQNCVMVVHWKGLSSHYCSAQHILFKRKYNIKNCTKEFYIHYLLFNYPYVIMIFLPYPDCTDLYR